MNLSIIVPGSCNAKCAFCFWKEVPVCDGYLNILDGVLGNAPSGEFSLSLTGGEPTISSMYFDILQLVTKHKNRFTKVVLTTNGFNLNPMSIYNVVDHVNISRHHYDDTENDNIFRCTGGTGVSCTVNLRQQCFLLNRHAIDVTLNCVLGSLRDADDVIKFIEYAKDVGASAIAFRKPAGTLDPSLNEQWFNNYEPLHEASCPVCRVKHQLIGGLNVYWKTSVIEPSDNIDEIYELIFHPTGKLTCDWGGIKLVDIIQGKISLSESEPEPQPDGGILDAIKELGKRMSVIEAQLSIQATKQLLTMTTPSAEFRTESSRAEHGCRTPTRC